MFGFFSPLFALVASLMLLSLPAHAVYTDADADQMFTSYNQAFYQTQTNNRAYYKEDTNGGRAWFWGQANMMEMVADAYDREPTLDRRNRLIALCRGFTNYHGENWAWNEFNDDIIWAVIVFTKTYLATNDTQFLNRATTNFNVVWDRAWATNGGLYWKGTSGSRNACVNAPAAIAACMLYEITGDVTYLDKAKSIITWMNATLMNPSGAVDDHITSGGSRNGWRFTYNQGTYVGACSALYRLTGEISHLQNAINATRYTRDSMCNAAGIFPDHGTSGDGGGFNGIGIRWIARMVKDQGLWDEFYPWLKANANAAWTRRRTADNLSWANWRANTPAPPAVVYSFGCYGSVVALQVVPSVDPSFTPDLAGPNPTAVYEAENAVVSGAVVATNVRGYRGTGFVDYGTASGESITWTVNAAAAGSHWISFRYGNGSTGNRTLRLRVNGSVIQDIPFISTGAWTIWSHSAGVTVPLQAGSNSIQLVATGSNSPNIDLLYVSKAPEAPPVGATVLFDGTQASLNANWRRSTNGAASNWTVSHGTLGVVRDPQTNDISSVEGFKDFKLHMEWLAPPGGLGQDAANSGVKLQGRYEIQILNTPRGQTPMLNGAGAIFGRTAPSANASLGAGHWQTYDIDFTAARWTGSVKIADARVTVRWNGVVVQDNVAVSSSTDSSPGELPGWHPILLQAEASAASGPVRFRNIWVLPKTSEIHEAELASMVGPARSTEHSGYQATGYADYGNTSGETITWSVAARNAGNHWVSFRYANGGSTDRPLRLMVNGSMIEQLPFGASGGWPTWIFTKGVSVPLNAGNNTIQLVSTMNGGPNVDYLYISEPPRPPPADALVLFDGTQASLSRNWKRDQDGSPSNWTVAGGALGVVQAPARNDISTLNGFKDFKLHLEWLSPPGGSGQLGGNSGVILQSRYEIQILNTPAGQAPAVDGAGAIYSRKAPDENASAGPGLWQAYDIAFTAPRWVNNVKVSNARVTVHWNGVLVHDDVELPGITGPFPAESPDPQPLLLQVHETGASGPVQFRNIWVTGESFASPAVTPEERWGEWLDQAGLTGADRAAGGDADGDGISNLWEYATGGNPNGADTLLPGGESRMPSMALATHSGERHVEMTFVRRADHAERGLVFSAESTTTLGAAAWDPRVLTVLGAPEPIGDGTMEKVRARVEFPLGQESSALIRLRVEVGE